MANRVANPDFETNTTGWAALGGATIARSTADYHSGSACLDVTTGTDWLGVMCNPVEVIDVSNQLFRISCWLKAATSGDIGRAVTMYAIASPGGQQEGLDFNLPADWAQYVLYHTWPASMSEYRFDVRANSGVATRFFLDDVFIDAATLDNCLPDADVVTTGWTTTPLFSKVNDASDATVIQATAG